MEFQVTVTPVKGPEFGGFVVAQTGYRETGVFTLPVPRWADLNDGDVTVDDVGFNLDLFP